MEGELDKSDDDRLLPMPPSHDRREIDPHTWLGCGPGLAPTSALLLYFVCRDARDQCAGWVEGERKGANLCGMGKRR